MRKRSDYVFKKTIDNELLEKLNKEIFPSDKWYENIKECVAWVIYYKKEPVGFCLLDITNKFHGYFSRAGIKKAHTGKGLHKRMIYVREKHARLLGYDRIVTYTKMDNIQSISNLQKCGYKMYIPKKLYADKDCIYWTKVI